MGGRLGYEECAKYLETCAPGKRIKYFIETGTSLGATIFNIYNNFEQCYTIELSEELFEKAVEKAKNDKIKNINFILGDSSVKLKELLQKDIFDSSAVFFLDSHFCGEGRDKGPEKDCARGEIDVPLLQELCTIDENYKFPCLIIVDDVSFFDQVRNGVDFSGINYQSILNCFKNKTVKNYFVSYDRFIIMCE